MPDASGLQPNISLGVRPPEGAGSNPLGMLNSFSEIQNRVNQNRLFQQEFAARQKFGQILSASPDMESGLSAAASDPDVAPYAGAWIGNYRQNMQTMQEIAGKKTEQNLSALKAFGLASAAAVNDPSMIPKIEERTISMIDPLIRKDAAPAIKNAADILLQGLPKDPKAMMAEYQKRHLALMVSSGLSGEAPKMLYGEPVTAERGGSLDYGLRSPTTGGVNFTTSVPKTLPPAITMLKPASGGGAEEPYATGGALGANAQPLGGPSAPGTADANALGVGPSVAKPGAPSAAPPSPGSLQGLTPGAMELQKKSAEIVGGIREKMSDQASQFPGQMHSLDVLHDMLTQAQAGGGANIRSQAASLVQAARNIGIPIDEETVNKIGNESLPASQTFSAIVNQVATRMLSADVHGQGKSMLPEVKAYLDQMSLATSPGAILNILNNMKFSMVTGFEQSKAYSQFRQKKEAGDPEVKGVPEDQFYTWYAEQQEKAKKLTTAPLSPEGVKGIAPKARPPLSSFFK